MQADARWCCRRGDIAKACVRPRRAVQSFKTSCSHKSFSLVPQALTSFPSAKPPLRPSPPSRTNLRSSALRDEEKSKHEALALLRIWSRTRGARQLSLKRETRVGDANVVSL